MSPAGEYQWVAELEALLARWRDASLDGDVAALGDLTDETTDLLAAAPLRLTRKQVVSEIRDAIRERDATGQVTRDELFEILEQAAG